MVTRADPYPYYAALVSRHPLGWDESLHCWVAASAASVTAILTSPLCRVRPPAEPVPAALVDSPAGDYFGRLVRQRDGPPHAHLKATVSAALRDFAASVETYSAAWAQALGEELQLGAHPECVTPFAFDLSVYAIASALGVGRRHLPDTAKWVADLARCLAPGATPAQLKRGQRAAEDLRDLVYATLLLQEATNTPGGFLSLREEGQREGTPSLADLVANGIGLLTQAYEATAGLIGNTLLALARHDAVYTLVRADLSRRDRLQSLMEEVLRYDPPVHNTRRYLAEDGLVAGVHMKAGDAVLVVLAAANYDPAVNPDPARFDLDRPSRRHFTFGAGVHACPGEQLATQIAASGVEYLLRSGLDVSSLPRGVTYRPSLNVRVPVFAKSRGGRRLACHSPARLRVCQRPTRRRSLHDRRHL